MKRKSGAFGLLWTNGKQNTLVSDEILALVVGLLALSLAVVVMVAVMPLSNPQVSPGMTGAEASSARWSALGELYVTDSQGSSGVGVTQAMAPDEAFVRGVALMGQGSIGYAAAGPSDARFGSLSMRPAEAEAYARSLEVASDEAFVRGVALTGQSSIGYAAAGPSDAPFDSLSMGPAEAEAYARSLAVASDEAFVRGVALTGQGSIGYAAAGPCGAPFCTLSMGPTEANAYARSLAAGAALAVASDEAFVRGVALTGQGSIGYAAAGPCGAPLCSLSMGPTEADAYARSLAQAGQGSVALVSGQ